MTLPVYRTVEDAISCVARFNAKSMTEIAAAMGWDVDQLSRASDPDKKPRFAASWIVPLTLTTGDFAIVRTICKLVGGVFFLLRRAESHDAHRATTFKEFADYIGALAKHDGQTLTHATVDDIENEMHDVISCMLSHVDKLRSEAK